MKANRAASPERIPNAKPGRSSFGGLRQGAASRASQWGRLELLGLLGLRGLWRKLLAPHRQSTRRIVLDSQADSLQDLADILSSDKASEFGRYEVVIPDDWIAWVSIPWMGPKLRDIERSAVVRQRLDALFGPSTDRHVALGGARFGWGQWVAAASSARIARVKALLKAHGMAKAKLVPAHAVAWRSYARWCKNSNTRVASVARGFQDQLFATVDGTTLTVSWQRFAPRLRTTADVRSGPALGIRNLSLSSALSLAEDPGGRGADGNGGGEAWVAELVRCLQREVLLQRLDKPQVVVVVRNRGSAAQTNVHNGSGWHRGILDACPQNWTLLQTQDWHSLADLRASHLGNAVGAQAPYVPKAGHNPNWMLKPDLDFSRPSGIMVVKPAWPNWVLGATLVCAFLIGLLYQQQSDQLTQLQEELEQATSQKLAESAKGRAQMRMNSPQTATERAALQQREQARASLAVPWESLFQCIESSVGAASTKGADVTLSQIQPDPNSGDLIIAGDARNYKAIGALVTRLEEHANAAVNANTNSNASGAMDAASKRQPHGVCRDLHLPYISSFQVNEQDSQRTVRFEIHASWIRPRPQPSKTDALQGQVQAPLASRAAVAAGVTP